MPKESSQLIDLKVCNNLLNFLSQPLTTISEFKYDVLKFLSNTFGYEHLFFHLVDDTYRFISPTTLNIENRDKLIGKYDEYFYKLCFFNPKNQPSSLYINKNVLTITDIMPLKEYEKTEIFQDLYRHISYYYLATSYLKSKGRLLGIFSLLKSKEDINFTSEEIGILDKIAPHIANRLCDYLELEQIKCEQQLYNGLVQEVPCGIILLNSRHSIVTYNNLAKELCEDILSDYKNVADPVGKVAKNIFSGIEAKDKNISTSLHINSKTYNLTIVPFLGFDTSKDLNTYYLIYINKRGTQNTDPNYLLAASYNLTDRETEIVELMAKGLSNKDIAEKLLISYNTVRTHVENIREKVGANNRVTALNKLGKLKIF